MKTLKKLLVPAFAVMLFAVNVSCFGGNKIDGFISHGEKFVNKWESKTSGEKPLSDDEKKELRSDLIDLQKIQLDIQQNPDLVKEITPEQEKKLGELVEKMAMIGIAAQFN